MEMKTNILTTALLLVMVCAKAQIPTGAMVVNDPAANSTLLQSLSQGAAQVQQGTEQLEFLKDAKDVVEKVNNVLRDVHELEEIYNIQKDILEKTRNDLRMINGTSLFYPSEIRNITMSYTNIVDRSIKAMEGLDKLLTNNLFKMNDAERLSFIREIKSEIRQYHTGTEVLRMKYIRMAEERALAQLFNRDRE